MSRRETIIFGCALLAFVALYGSLPLLAGGLFLEFHEVDSYHLLDILIRMTDGGQLPHLDFVTPLGILAFWPIAALINLGFPAGTAAILAQIAVAAALFPLVIYVCATRLTRGTAHLFGFFTLGLVLALTHGGPDAGVTFSMHYNRWAWGIAFVLLALAFIPSRNKRPGLDGVLIGVLGGVLLLLKVTYFVALVPVAALEIARRSGLRSLAAAVAGGLVVLAIAALLLPLSFWPAYLDDLRLVATSDVRPNSGVPLNEVIASPAYIGATLIGIAAVALIRKTGRESTATSIILLIPGFIYIVYQNFGNDPQWLIFVAVLLLALRPAPGTGEVLGIDLSRAMETTAALAVAIFFPSLFNIAMSPVEHLAFDKSRFLPMLPEEAGHQDIYIRDDRAYTMTAQVFKDHEDGAWSRFSEKIERPEPSEYGGITFPSCEWMAGSRGYLEVLTADLAGSGIPEDSRILNADIIAALWHFGPWTVPEGSAPWYYGNLTGIENTDYILVPKCAFVPGFRQGILEELKDADIATTLVRNNDLLALFRVD